MLKRLEGVIPISTGCQTELKPPEADRTLGTIASFVGDMSSQTHQSGFNSQHDRKGPQTHFKKASKWKVHTLFLAINSKKLVSS